MGALGLWSPEGRFFEDERLALCEQLALLVSHSLERLKSRELHAEIVRLGRLALVGGELDGLLGKVASSIVRTLEATSCTVDERLADGTTLRRAQAGDVGLATEEAYRIRLPITGNGTRYGQIEVTSPRGDRVSPEQQGYLGTVVNILAGSLERCRVETRLSHLALHDPLTGMPNRLLLLDRLSEALARAERGGPCVGVLFVDLDRFKLVNDALGHSCGDRLLLDVATRLAETVGIGPTIARIGGDEFAVLCEAPLAAGLAKRIARSLEAPFAVASGSTFVTASVGIALSRPGVSVEELLREADTAMYAAKQRGRDRFAFFDDEPRVKALRWLEVEAELRGALQKGELRVHYQPIYALTGTVCGLEALVRWHHPARGLVPPGDFIPIAEDTGVIWELGAQVLEVVCAQLETWRSVPLLRDLPVAVNVSGVQLANAGLPALVHAALSHYDLPASRLQVEITETALMRDTDGATRALEAMRELGVRTAIDDFGTGYSSLHYLRHLPVDAIKIDRGFVAEIDSSGVDLAIIRSVVELAKVLGLRTIAEGVERPAQLEALRGVGCDLGQGYLFSRAVPVAEVQGVLQRMFRDPRHARTMA